MKISRYQDRQPNEAFPSELSDWKRIQNLQHRRVRVFCLVILRQIRQRERVSRVNGGCQQREVDGKTPQG